MRIGFILISEGFSGAEKSVYYILKEILRINIDKIYLITNEEVFNYYSQLKNLNLFNIGKINKGNPFLNFISYFMARKKINKIIKTERLDIVNSHMDLANFVSPALNKHINVFCGTDIVSLTHPPSLKYRFGILPKIRKNLNKSLFILSKSFLQIKDLPEKYKKKTVVIPNGVDLEVFKPLNNVKQKKNVILFAGRFIDIKGIQEIVNVAKQLPKYEFWFAGQGPLENLINLPNTKNLGFKSTEELVKLYNQATICIFPSHRESFGLVGLEAMACGKAVIATPLGFSEYIENGEDGIIIPTKDEGALKDAIVDLMTNEKKRKIFEKNARKKALQYSWEGVAKKYIKFFKEVLEKSE